ncbi:MAG: hypothetical protein IT530_16265 [Burkholderiales bacterium]|nr:hypothetical protein [Burkholderiales bacterium]
MSAAEPTNSLGLRPRSVLDARRNDAAPDDFGAKKLSSPAQFAGIFRQGRAIDRSMKGVSVPAGENGVLKNLFFRKAYSPAIQWLLEKKGFEDSIRRASPCASYCLTLK